MPSEPRTGLSSVVMVYNGSSDVVKSLPGVHRSGRQVIHFVPRPRFYMARAATVLGKAAIRFLSNHGYSVYEGLIDESIPEAMTKDDFVDTVGSMVRGYSHLSDEDRKNFKSVIDAIPTVTQQAESEEKAKQSRLGALNETPVEPESVVEPEPLVYFGADVPDSPPDWWEISDIKVRPMKALYKLITGKPTGRDWSREDTIERLLTAAKEHDPPVRVWDGRVFEALLDMTSLDDLPR